MELTKELFQETVKGLATKKDLETLATKDELKNLATKDQLKDLRAFIGEHMLTKTEFAEIRKELADKNDISQILTSIDAIAKQMTIYNQELPAITHQLQTITAWIKQASKKIGVEYKP
jgi:hypothetical protein